MGVHSLPDKKKSDRAYWLLGLEIASDFGAAIALPLVLSVIAGQWLDARTGRGPAFTIAAFALAAAISGRLVYTKAKRYAKRYEEMNVKR